MKIYFLTFLFSLSFLYTFSQNKVVFQDETPVYWSDNKALKASFKKFKIFKINAAPIRDYLNGGSGSQPLHLKIGKDMSWELQMEAHDIRNPLYTERAMTNNGIVSIPKRDNITFRGTVTNGGKAALTIDDHFLYGFIQKEDKAYFIEPLNYIVKGAPQDLYIIYEASDAIHNEIYTCGVAETQHKTEELHHELENQNRLVGNCYVVQLAIASDYLMYEGYQNSTTNVGNHNIGVMNNVQTNYTGDFADDIQFQIVTQYYSTTPSEPWTNLTDIEAVLDDFTSWSQSGGFGTTHDIGQFWTKRNFDGPSIGLAWVGAVCTSFKYHVLQDFTIDASQLRCMTAHELGHNFNVLHDGDNSTHIMAPYVSSSNTWSNGSQSSMNAYIVNRANLGTCFTFCSTPPVQASPTAQFVGSPTSGCVPMTVQFTDQSAGTPTSWSWSFPGGTPGTSTSQNPSVTYNTGGTYSVTLTATNASGADQEIQSNYITVTALPIANFTTFTSGGNAVFTNTSTGATSYLWAFGDGATSTQTSPTHFYAASGIYSVTLTATNNCGSDTEIKNITIVLAPVADFSANVTQGCAPLMVQFTDQSSNNPTSWSWSFPGGAPTSSTQQNPSIVYNFPGTYNVTLTATNSAGQDGFTINGYIIVQAAPNAGFTSSSTGLNASFTNTSTNATSYLWNFGDGTASTTVNPAHTYPSGGNYAVSLTATGPCGSDMQINSIVVLSRPDPDFSANITSGCAPLTVSFMDISTGNPTSWSWSFPGGSPTSSALQNPVVVYNTPGSYNVSLTATNASGDSTATVLNFITINTAIPPNVSNQTACAGSNVTLNAGTGYSSYLWSNGGGTSQSATYNNVTTNTTYTVTVTQNGCTATDQATVTVTTATADAGANQTICTGQTATLTASGGGTYQWSNNLGNNATATTPALTTTTTYTVTVTSGNCTATDQVTVNVGNITADAGANQSICTGQTASLSASGGGTYQWSNNLGNNATATTPALTTTTTYTVTVTSGNCTDTDQVTVNVGTITADAGTNQSICSGQTATLTASGGGTYQWSNNLGNNATATTPALTTTTTYTITVTSGNCTATDQVTVNVGNITANAGANQSICTGQTATLTASGGGTYQWSNNLGNNATATTPALTTTTTYTVTVTSGNCTATDQVTVNVGNITADAGANQSICTGQTASLTASGSGTYQWSNNLGNNATATTPALTTTTTYTVTVTSGNCTDTDQVTVNVGNITADAGANQNICTGQTVTLTASGGGTYQWSNNLGNNATATTPALTTTTTYTVTVTSGNCTATDQVTVNVGNITADAGTNQNICTGQTVTLTASGGGTYQWSNNLGNNATATTPALTTTTTYTVTVTSGNCTDTDQVTVDVGNITADAGANQSICTGQTATLTASGGGTYQWSNNLGNNATATTPALTTTTTYTVTVTSGNCTATDQVTVNVGNITADAGTNQNICTGQTVTLTASGGGTYQWSNNLGNNATATTPALTTTTTYIVTVTSGNCTATDQITINVGTITADAGANQSICTGQTATLTASGGGTYQWSNNLGNNATATTPALTTTSTYTVTVTSGNCTATDQVTVDVGNISADAGANQSICTGQTATLTASGGGTYQWSNNLGNNATATTPALTTTTTYTITVTSGNCTATDQVTVDVGNISADAGANQSICTGQTATLMASGGGTYQWSNNLGNNATATTPALTTTSTYTVTVTSGNCTATDQVTVDVETLTADAGVDQNICAGQVATLTATGGTLYQWSDNLGNNATAITPSLASNMTYTVTVTSGNCTATDYVNVNIVMVAANAGKDQTACEGQTATLAASGGDTYQWSNNLGNNATVMTPPLSANTTYVVTVTNNNCTDTDEMTIYISPLPDAEFTSNIISQQAVFSNISSEAISFDWSFGDGNTSVDTSPMHNYENSGIYTVSLIATNNCGSDTAYEEVDIILINTDDLADRISFGLYPNPNNGQFTLTFPGVTVEIVKYKMINVLGQLLDEQVLSFSGSKPTKQFDYPNLVAGSYFITLNAGGKSVVKKIIVF